MAYTSDQYERFWLNELGKVTRTGTDRLRAACPIHDGDNPMTLSINLTTGFAHCFKCHGDGQGWSMIEFAMVRYGFDRHCANDYVRGQIGEITKPSIAPWRFPFPKPTVITSDEWRLGTLAQRIVGMIEFFDMQGEPGWSATAQYAYETVASLKYRALHKPTGEKRLFWLTMTAKGGWTKPAKLGVVAPPYRCASLAGQEEIWLLNGEKAVDRAVEAWGITATCLPNGEAHWKPEYLSWFLRARVVYVVLDNDAQGEQHGKIVGGALALAGCNARLVRLPGLPEKADCWDFIEQGGTLEEACQVARNAPAAEAYAEPPKNKVREMPRRDASSNNGTGGNHSNNGTGTLTGPDLTAFENTDAGNAERLVLVAGDKLRFAEHLDQSWLSFTGQFWQPGAARSTYTPAIHTLRLLKQQANDKGEDKLWNFAHSKLSHGGIHAMIHQAEPKLAIDVRELDRHPLLINCSNGVFDLETGELRPHAPEDLLTRCFLYPYDPTLPPPLLWLRSLDEWFGASPDADTGALERAERMSLYFRRILGYALTGNIDEKAFFVLYGSGNNGKTTCTGTMQEILGDFSVTISPGTLTRGWGRNENNVMADIARTKGARAIFAAEPTEGQRFDQGLLKMLTQGEVPITAVFKGRQPFSFLPTGKLFLETNQVPDFDSEDSAFLKRIHLVHFLASFPGGERARETRRHLLRAEAAQIFNLAIKDARDCLKDGLQRPEECGLQMREIRDQQARNDELEPFLEEFFVRGAHLRATLADIEALYRPWTERHRLRALPRNQLSRKLCERIGITRGNDPGDHHEPAWLRGLAPKTAPTPPSGRDAQFKEPEDD
jgi:putative DNA primase/helicase